MWRVKTAFGSEQNQPRAPAWRNTREYIELSGKMPNEQQANCSLTSNKCPMFTEFHSRLSSCSYDTSTVFRKRPDNNTFHYVELYHVYSICYSRNNCGKENYRLIVPIPKLSEITSKYTFFPIVSSTNMSNSVILFGNFISALQCLSTCHRIPELFNFVAPSI